MSNNVTANFPAAGAYPYGVDYAKGGDNHLTLTMLSGGAPIPPLTVLTLTPNSTPTITSGQIQTLQVAGRRAESSRHGSRCGGHAPDWSTPAGVR